MSAALLLAAGLVAGVVSGMGIGGGAVLIPCLCLFAGMSQREAQAINLIYFMPTAVMALYTHYKNGRLDMKWVKGMALYGLIGAVAGAFTAMKLPQETLRKLFGYFLLAAGVYELFRKGEDKQRNTKCEAGKCEASRPKCQSKEG